MAYFLIEPGHDLVARDYIQLYTGIRTDVTPSEDEIKELDVGNLVKMDTKSVDYNAAVKIASNITKAEGKYNQKIVIFSYERSASITKKISENSSDGSPEKKEYAQWHYGAGFRIVVNHMSTSVSSSLTLAALSAEATLGLSNTTILIQAYGSSKLMPEIPNSISGFTTFDSSKLPLIDKWVDEAKVAIGDGWSKKTPEQQQKIKENTTPQLIGIEVSNVSENVFNSVDELSLFCMWRFVYSDTLEKTLKHLKSSQGEASKRAREFPNLITEANIKHYYRQMFIQYGALSDLDKEKITKDEYLMKMSVPEPLRMRSKNFVAVYRSAG